MERGITIKKAISLLHKVEKGVPSERSESRGGMRSASFLPAKPIN